jgi:hypothetical protein
MPIVELVGTSFNDDYLTSTLQPVLRIAEVKLHKKPGCRPNLVPRSLFRSLHKSLETAKTTHKILVGDFIFEYLQVYSIDKFN